MADGVNIDWSLASQPNFAQAALSGFQAGHAIGKERAIQQAMTGLDVTKPETLGPLLRADPATGAALLSASIELHKAQTDAASKSVLTDYLLARDKARGGAALTGGAGGSATSSPAPPSPDFMLNPGNPAATAQSTIPSTSGPGATDPAYQQWLAKTGVTPTPDYNTYGAFKAGVQPAANGHLDDTYKLPNHVTYSTDSLSSKQPGAPPAGTWTQTAPPAQGKPEGTWAFQATATNVANAGGIDRLKQYFDQSEPGNTVILPDGTRYVGGSSPSASNPNGDIVVTAQNTAPQPSPLEAARTALMQSDPEKFIDLQSKIGAMDKADRERVDDASSTLAAMAQSVKMLPYEQRGAYIQQHKSELLQHGLTEQQIAGFDPTDQNIAAETNQALGVKGILEQQDKDRTFGLSSARFGEEQRHNRTDEGQGAARIGIAAGQLGVAKGHLALDQKAAAGKAGAAGGGISTPTNAAEYNSLPAGARYYKNGVIRVKQ